MEIRKMDGLEFDADEEVPHVGARPPADPDDPNNELGQQDDHHAWHCHLLDTCEDYRAEMIAVELELAEREGTEG